jgi:AcrR family transcriptional regulator
MVQITHSKENLEKITSILEAAQKRFGLYGLEKTTMSEIASDINMSKGSIYYYFPDKEQLYKAVIEKEHDEFLQKVKERIDKMSDPAEMLKEYVKINLQFFRIFLNLSRTKLNEIKGLNPLMKEIVTSQRTKETTILINIFKKGNENGYFGIQNPEDIAILFLDLLRGLRRMIVGKKEVFYLEKEEYDEMTKKVFLFTEIFINGLMFKLLKINSD